MTTPDLRTELVLEERPTGRATRLSAATRRLQYFREGGLVVAILLTGTIFALINSTFVDVQNLTNELFLYNFESVFSGTHVGFPRLLSGRIALKFK